MPRVYRPMRLFVEEDGKRKPTLFFFIFFFWVFAALFMLAYTLLTKHARRSAAAAYLSRTPTPTPTSTSTPTVTPTPTITPTPSDTATPTPFVYSDPANWELIEVKHEDGSTTLELQDWQKAEIFHFFEEYYNLAWHSTAGLPDLESVLKYTDEYEYEDLLEVYYPELVNRGYYLQYPSLDHLLIEITYRQDFSDAWGGFRVEITLNNPINWETKRRDIASGEIIDSRDYGPTAGYFQVNYQNKHWLVYHTAIVRLDN